MRILHIVNDVTDRGNGIINAAIDLAAGQVEQGHMVVIASAGGGHEPLLRRLNIEHLPLDQTRRPVALMKAVVTLRRYLREVQPDIVHVHTRTALLLAWLVTRFTRHPLVAHVQNVHERVSVMMRLADRVIVCSDSVGKTMQTMGIPEAKIRLVHNAPFQSPRQPSFDTVPMASIEHPADRHCVRNVPSKGNRRPDHGLRAGSATFPGYAFVHGWERPRDGALPGASQNFQL